MISRRSMLKALGLATGISVLTYAGSICDSGKHGLEEKVKIEQRKGFDGLWDRVLNFNEKYNHFYEGKSSKDDVTKAWEDIIEYNRTNFPQLFENGKFDYWKYQDLCRENGKVYVKLPHFKNPDLSTIVLGDIVENKKENFSFNGKNVAYNVVLYEQEGKSIEDITGSNSRIAFWDERINAAFINITGMKEDADYVYKMGALLEGKEPKTFRQAMIKELYQAVMSDVKKKKPLNRQKAFEDGFIKAITRSSINHERMHYFFPHSKDAEESIRKEKETFLHQIAEDPVFNSWVFLTAYGDGRYDELYKAFENSRDKDGVGYTKERLMGMDTKDRAGVAQKILSRR